MKILYFTDIHYIDDIKNISEIKNNINITTLDVIIIGGDITNFGNYSEAKVVINELRKINSNVLAIPGNCDDVGVTEYLLENKINLDDIIYEYNNYLIIGIGGSLKTPFNTPNEYSEEQFNDKVENILDNLSKYNNKNIILVTHQPPFGIINDKIQSGIHIGSNSINRFIQNKLPIVCLTGHVHEGIGVDMIDNIKVINPGPARDGNYAIVDIYDNNNINIKMF